jgi:hypothetical protein
LVHLFDMRSSKAPEAVEAQRIDFTTDKQGEVVATLEADLSLVQAEQQPDLLQAEHVVEAELPKPQPKPARKAKAPRKTSSRRPSTTKGATVIELAPPVDADVDEPAAVEPETFADFASPSETPHPHIEPLFEPERFGRMPRRAFGRRGQL